MVYVISKQGQPLMPCSKHGKVKHLLKSGKAKVIRRCPFTIQLTYDTSNYRQVIACGVDTGSKNVGVACVGNNKVLYQSQIELRDNIKSKIDEKREYRRSRRFKLRYRKIRWLNRKNSIKNDRYSPTLKSKFDSHVKEIKFCKKILPITILVLETGKFDTQLIEKPWLQKYSWAYQKGINYGYANSRAHALDRDKYTCQCCGKKHTRLEVHHIVYRSNNGSDDLENLITLCEDCHADIHDGTKTLKLKGKKKSSLRYATQMSVLRNMLLKYYPDAIETFGYVTKANREALGLTKDHYIDAILIASNGQFVKFNNEIFYKKCISKQNRSMRKGVRGEKDIPLGKVLGFRKFDKIKYFGQECFIKARRNSGAFVLMDIFGKNLDFRSIGGKANPSYKVLQRLQARTSCLTERRNVIFALS